MEELFIAYWTRMMEFLSSVEGALSPPNRVDSIAAKG